MIGFTKSELEKLLKEYKISQKEQENILPIMKENYDGYKFSVNGQQKIYNSNLCLYFLADYLRLGKIPEQLIDVNIASDYSKLGKMLDLCKGENKKEIIEKTITGEGIINEITSKFNPEIEFKEKELISMLYYLGYLTITGQKASYPKLNIPNTVMKEIYSQYFLQILEQQIDISIDNEYIDMAMQVALEGKIEKIIERLSKYISNLSNRDYIKFDEKYVKLIFYCISMNLKIFSVKSEKEIEHKYPDILLIPKERDKGYNSIMIEFKYLKKDEEKKLQEKQKEAKEQIEEYSKLDYFKDIEKLNKYTVVAINDKIYVEKIL